MFQLEALKARHGDCLLLHWGDAQAPKLALIDGGPGEVYGTYLKPRLATLAKEGRNRIDLMMLSHIDDDHINGLLDLADDIESKKSPMTVDLLWFNSLEGLLDEDVSSSKVGEVTASIRSTFKIAGTDSDPWAEKVLASVPQGQDLVKFAKREGLLDDMNAPYRPLVMLGAKPDFATIEGLRLTPVAPSAKAIEALRKVWKVKRKEGATAAYSDRSPYNLSSIVVIAEFDEKSMLLTGDALGRDILEGLLALGRLDKDGRAHFNLMKLPHHGSQNNVTQDFFEAITADHYMVSGDHVKFPNPHSNAMTWLANARGDDKYHVYCPYELDYMREIFGDRLVTPVDGINAVTATLV